MPAQSLTQRKPEVVYVMRCPDQGRYVYDFAPAGRKTLMCRGCGQRHEASQTEFKKLPNEMRVQAPFDSHYSLAHGRKLESWSDVEKANKELGLIYTGDRPKEKFPPANRTMVQR